jgi:hypothetical protein
MTRHVLPWVILTVVGVALAAIQLGDGLIIQRPEARLTLFLGGAVIAMAGLLKVIAVATDPDLHGKDAAKS